MSSEPVIDPVELFRLLGEPTRLAVVMLLTRQSELCVCDLMSALDVPQSRISRHLGILRAGGLLADERRGQWVYYRLAVAADSPEHSLLLAIAERYQSFVQPFANRLTECIEPDCCGGPA